MAWYKHGNFLQQSNSDAYDLVHQLGSRVPHSGIYRCMGCGREIAANEGDPFPPQNHHQHSMSQGNVRWRLIVFADGTAKTS